MLPSRELRSESLSCGQASHCSFVVNILHRAVEPAKWRTHSSLPAASTVTADAVLPSKPSATDRRVCPRPSQYDLQDKGPRLDQEPSFLVQRLLSQPRSSHREAIKNGSIRRAKLLPKSSDGGVKRHRAPSPSCCLAAIMDMLRGRHARRPNRPTQPALPRGPLVYAPSNAPPPTECWHPSLQGKSTAHAKQWRCKRVTTALAGTDRRRQYRILKKKLIEPLIVTCLFASAIELHC